MAGTDVMKFWAAIFPDAMDQFRAGDQEPPGCPGDLSIRGVHSWNTVLSRLNSARDSYLEETDSTSGRLTGMRRKAADSWSKPASSLVKLVPDIHSSVTPVVGAVKILLEVSYSPS